jgi:hypothetical protein
MPQCDSPGTCIARFVVNVLGDPLYVASDDIYGAAMMISLHINIVAHVVK